jgi:hypothetical protein
VPNRWAKSRIRSGRNGRNRQFRAQCELRRLPTGNHNRCHAHEGWHLLSITLGVNDSSISIDGNPIFSLPGSFTFDTVQLEMFGPAFRPNTVAYFDDFSISANSVPEPRGIGWAMAALFFCGLAVRTYLRKKNCSVVQAFTRV